MDNRSCLACGAAAGAIFALACAILTSAGPLDPPAGAVSPTHKTLTEIEPRTAINATDTAGDADSVFKITQPGSYYLTGNLTGVSGKHGIEVAAGDVFIDLCGFRMVGNASSTSLNGIHAISQVRNVSVRNGTVTGWGGIGVNLASGASVSDDNGLVENMHASSNGDQGIRVGGNSVVVNCTAAQNGSDGFSAGYSSLIERCHSANNGGDGFSAGSDSTILDCVSTRNDGYGFDVSTGCIVDRCNAVGQTLSGFRSFGSTPGTKFNNCRASLNLNDGFIFSSSVATGCIAYSNTEAGFRVTAAGSRVDECTAGANGTGFASSVANSIYTRNTARGNTTNYDIVAGNSVAPLVNVTGSNNWGAIPNADSPWANFGY